eukprot:TRINITY_DN4949_c0_g1_i2.p1 TRINITY_DN4949_c0_g1~~TRINITY_DN4949_c0_g1_i2.p1  ORF type:complete len:189 (-),score=31.86 TRINITY_DN4949_c0_g1_i2:271-837(-)
MGTQDKEKIKHGLAGAMARLTEAMIMFPIDVVKTRLQYQNETSFRRYTGVFNGLKLIARDEGVSGFTRGLAPRLAYIVPAAAVSFLCYEEIVSVVSAPKQADVNWYHTILPLTGILGARIIGSFCRTPFDILKMRLQIQGTLATPLYTNTRQAFKATIKNEGFRGLFFIFLRSSTTRHSILNSIFFSL